MILEMKHYFAKTLQVFSFKNDVYFSHAQSYQKMYPHFKNSHFFYDLKYSAEALSI